jgi:chaperone modulatory protein CbpM
VPDSKALTRVSEVVEPLTLTDLCRISGCSAEWVLELVEEGILEPSAKSTGGARFDSSTITVLRKVQRLQADLRVNLPGIALVLSLTEENARLKRRLRQMQDDLPIVIQMPDLDH